MAVRGTGNGHMRVSCQPYVPQLTLVLFFRRTKVSILAEDNTQLGSLFI